MGLKKLLQQQQINLNATNGPEQQQKEKNKNTFINVSRRCKKVGKMEYYPAQ